MADTGTGTSEHRRHARVHIERNVRATQRDITFHGRVKDISVGGAAVEMSGDLSEEEDVALHFEDLADVTGQVVRPLEDGFAFSFDPDEIDEDPFLDDIMRLHDEIQTEDL